MDISLKALAEAAKDGGIARATLRDQARRDHVSEEKLIDVMREALAVMRASCEHGMDKALRSLSGMTGGRAPQYFEAAVQGRTAGGAYLGRAGARALAIAECNAAMGRIVAAPTAGACGILPAALLTAQEEYGLSDDQLIDALFVAAAVGRVIAEHASISGAEGGCQAECGSAAAMTAAALAFLRGGSPECSCAACAFALMNSLGLVCDPVHGLVEIPCVYRNVAGVAVAFTSADLALSGIPCPMPPDEMIDAMRAVGDALPASLRETGEGGCAACPAFCNQ